LQRIFAAKVVAKDICCKNNCRRAYCCEKELS